MTTRKLAQPLSEEDAASAVEQLSELPVIGCDSELIRTAIGVSRSAQLSLWDALIVQAAVVGGCQRILTEDLRHGAVIIGVHIENPFASALGLDPGAG